MDIFDGDFAYIWLKLAMSLLIGILIGAEREYKNKSAGLRTITLICLGSTVFTIVSLEASHETEVGRIASNIVTGIGFLGAGAIMRDGFNVSGLTTASTIWVAASLGMAVGFGQYELAVTATGITLVVLVIFNSLQKSVDEFHKTIDLFVIFNVEDNGIDQMEAKMKGYNLKFEKKKEIRRHGDVQYNFEVSGRKKNLTALINYLIDQKDKVKSFEY